MKIWIKYLIGIVTGTALALIFSENHQAAIKILTPAAEVFINIGRYCFYPLLFFSLTIAVHELLNSRRFLSIHWKSITALVSSTVVLTVTGIISTLIFSPERIPVLLEKKETLELLSFKEHLLEIFPSNLFSIFNSSGNFILPLLFLAFLIGQNLNYDRTATKPVVQLCDSLNRIFYHINSFILEILAPGIIVFSAIIVFRVSSIQHIALYKQLFLILLINSVFLIFLVFPAVLYMLGMKEKPYKYIFALTGAALTGFLTGDNYLANNILIKHSHENLGVPRQSGAVTISIFTIFGRAGTAMVTAVCFIIILNSYSGIGITFPQILWLFAAVVLSSFILGTVPAAGTVTALALICSAYGHGIEDGFLIFSPVIPFLLSFSVLLDVMTAGLASMLVARFDNIQKDIDIKDFI